ncbi:MAG: ROK family protein [Gemmataceae bacterium]|nr:ROK family protein [Gemmataceae bacterium]
MQDRLFVGLDVGGTTIKAAVVDDLGQPLSRVSLPTLPERGQEAGLNTMAEAVRAAIGAAGIKLDDVAAIGVATPGSMDLAAGLILDPPNLKPWRNVPVRQYISDTFRKPTAFQNDANAAAYGEFWVGAGKFYRSMVLFTLGTGVGGGIILEDRIIEGAHSHGGELGHIKIEITNGRPCGCGHRGCLEAYASATAVVQRTREALAARPGVSTLDADRMTSKDVFDAAAAGDALAAEIVDRTAFYLAVGASNAIHTVDPELVCFAGGMTAAGPEFLNLIGKYIHDVTFAWPAERVAVRYAVLGSDAGIIGAAGCGRLLVS